MQHDENSSESQAQEVNEQDDSIGGLSTSFGSDDEGSQAEEVSFEESSRDESPARRAPTRRERNANVGGRREGGARGRPRGRGVASAQRTSPAPRARTTTRGAGRGRSRRPVKGAAKFCGRCGHPVRDKDGHSHKSCGRTYFYKFSVN